MTVLSLFDGISCAQIALKRAGIAVDSYYASEINKYAIAVTKKNFPQTIQLGDVRDIKADKLPKIDLLIGGSPCQGFSLSGKQLNFKDERSKLFFEYARILKEVKPRYFLLENVAMKKTIQDVISEKIGCQPIKINSDLVTAQSRRRLYWTNIKNIEQPQDKHIFIEDILEEKEVNFYYTGCAQRGRYNQDGVIEQRIESRKDKKANAVTTVSKDSMIMKESSGVSYIRKLTQIERERLQTIPDNYTEVGIVDGKEKKISNYQRCKMVGNAFTVDVIAHILKQI